MASRSNGKKSSAYTPNARIDVGEKKSSAYAPNAHITVNEQDMSTRTRWIDDQLTLERSQEAGKTRLLLLGAGESGKSTVLKQFRLLNNMLFTNDERANAKKVIYRNVFDSCLELAKYARRMSATDDAYLVNVAGFGPLIRRYVEVENCDVDRRGSIRSYRPDLAMIKLMTKLWVQPGVQLAFRKHRNELQIYDSVEYFLEERANELTDPEFVPNDMDMLQVRQKTLGVTELSIDKEGVMNIIDVGGQRSERRKWIGLFDGSITAILFVVALSGYAQRCFEDGSKNRLHEALDVFESVMTRDGFDDVNIILFLNKRDIFAKQIKETPLTSCLPEYAGDPHDYEECINYIRSQFEAINEARDATREMYSHVTCATDQNAMSATLLAVQHIVISNIIVTSF